MGQSDDQVGRWADPGTRHAYPLSYDAYRRTREAEERPLPRHKALGRAADRHVWTRWRAAPVANVEVLMSTRADAPPRVRRIVAEVLRAIRRGRPAGQAIGRVSRRFGLTQARTRACLAASIVFQVRPISDEVAPGISRSRSFAPPPPDWM